MKMGDREMLLLLQTHGSVRTKQQQMKNACSDNTILWHQTSTLRAHICFLYIQGVLRHGMKPSAAVLFA